jgi:myo-inositol-1(or 4)-monophosphatase
MKFSLPKKLSKNSLEIVEEVAKILNRHRKHLDQLKVTSKKAQGVVSSADYEAENYILTQLKGLYPSIPFLAEESTFLTYQGKKTNFHEELKNDWIWVIDPLDGTNNFLAGLDYFAISIALCFQGEVVFGIIHRPVTGLGLIAESAKATKQYQLGRKQTKEINYSLNNKRLKDSMFATGFITEKGKPVESEFNVFKQMMANSRGIRRMGSACLDLSMVASGQLDGFWEQGLPPWDVAAAKIICQNAGAKVTNFSGRPYELGDSGIIAARAPLHQKLFKQVAQSARV